jgi:protein SCO1/2
MALPVLTEYSNVSEERSYFMRRSCVFAVGTFTSLIIVIWGLFLVQAASASSRWGANYFPNVSLTTQDGKTVHLYDDLLKGKTVVVNLIYTHCQDSCPLETARLAQVQHMLGDRVGKDIFFYSISIDPENDTPEVLKSYAEKFHAGPGWLFLTGKKADIDLVGKKLGLYSDPALNRDGHTTDLMIGNEPSGQWTRNNATDNPRFLFVTISTLLDGFNGGKQQQAPKSYAEAPRLNVADKGQYLFATRCAACHTIGHGDFIGPDLLGVTNSLDRSWLMRFIQKPDQMFADQDPVAMKLFKQYKEIRMPNVRLGPDDTEFLVKYLEAQTAAASNQVGLTKSRAKSEDGTLSTKTN